MSADPPSGPRPVAPGSHGAAVAAGSHGAAGAVRVSGGASAEDLAALLAALSRSPAVPEDRAGSGYEGWRRHRLAALRRRPRRVG